MSGPCWALRGSQRTISTTCPCGCPAGSPSVPWRGPATARWPPVRETLMCLITLWWGDAPPCCFGSFKPLGFCSFRDVFTLEMKELGVQTDTHIHIQMTVWRKALRDNKESLQILCSSEPICSVGENYKTSPKRVLNVNYFIISYCLVNLNCWTFLHEIR